MPPPVAGLGRFCPIGNLQAPKGADVLSSMYAQLLEENEIEDFWYGSIGPNFGCQTFWEADRRHSLIFLTQREQGRTWLQRFPKAKHEIQGKDVLALIADRLALLALEAEWFG